jgi:glutathione synthase/RimK-type ligase-like ATP-grasp enzyme
VQQTTAIIIAPPDDIHALTVAWEIRQLGGTPFILNLADFPTGWTLCMNATSRTRPVSCLRTPDGHCIDDSEISGVWWRRTRPFEIPAQVTEQNHRDFCAAEARALFEGWIYSLGERVINPFAAELAARRKPYQLGAAARIGLKIPRSLVTNDRDKAADFIAQNAGPLIYKALTPTSWQVTETRELDEDAKTNLHLLNVAPVIFQERIDGGPDIRVTIVDDDVFAAELAPTHPEARLDWRLDPAIEPTRHSLAEATARQLLTLQHSLGLRYGAYDFRIDAAGEYVFFEVNPAGQYLFVEISTGHRISHAIARALLHAEQRQP